MTTQNPADAGPQISLSGGNLTSTVLSTVWNSVRSTTSKSSGAFYVEWLLGSQVANGSAIGFADNSPDVLTTLPGNAANSVGIQMAPGGGAAVLATGSFVLAAGLGFTLPAAPSGSIAMGAIDVNAGKGWLGLNGSWFAGGNPATGANPFFTFTPGIAVFIATSEHSPSDNATLRPSSSQQTYFAPSGFVSWDPPSSFFLPPVPLPADSTARQRGPSFDVWISPVGNNAWDGSQATYGGGSVGPKLDADYAFDFACAEFEITSPYATTDEVFGGYLFRPGVNIRLAPSSTAQPHLISAKAKLKRCPHPVYLIGDVNNPAAYNLYAQSALNGLGNIDSDLILLGFTLAAGADNTTLLNGLGSGALVGGYLSLLPNGKNIGSYIGGAGKSRFCQAGPISLGAGQVANSFEFIEQSQCVLGTGTVPQPDPPIPQPITLLGPITAGGGNGAMLCASDYSIYTPGDSNGPEWINGSYFTGHKTNFSGQGLVKFSPVSIPGI